MRCYSHVALPLMVFGFLLGISQAHAAEGTLSEGNLDVPIEIRTRMVQVNVEDVTCRRFLEALGNRAKIKYVIEDDFADTKMSTRMPGPLPFEKVLQSRVFHSGIDCRIDEAGVFHFFRMEKTPEVAGYPELGKRRLWTMAPATEPVRTQLEWMFRQAGVRYYIDPRVTAENRAYYQNKHFREALRELLMLDSTTPLTFRVRNGVYVVFPKDADEPHIPEELLKSAP